MEDATKFWNDNFGTPDYFSKAEDFTEISELLIELSDELDSLEREVKRIGDNMNAYRMNRTIALHFTVEAGQEYLRKLNDVVYDNTYEAELEKLDSITKNCNYFED